jgi:hypothetical protein
MTTPHEMKLQKIERVSFLLRAICTALYVPVIVIGIAATIAILAGLTAHISYAGQTFIPAEMTPASRLLLAVVGVATAAVLFKALHHLRRLAGNYARREIFTAESARQIRQFGVTCMLWGVIKLIWAFLPLAVSTGRSLVYVTTDAIWIGAVIVGLSWFAEMAAALREENDLTV